MKLLELIDRSNVPMTTNDLLQFRQMLVESIKNVYVEGHVADQQHMTLDELADRWNGETLKPSDDATAASSAR